ncbi:sister chromatid cohesion protein pds5 [Phtheirospermum japonicum]|uniref:Sister chromatid cohesion protein pds5 n=1 Tax=Phtheirospermum japonicum TaxID=374723 RepID=A0A830D611_9LAMI|nr:sister chromatid cohesion protein pds5 [Phtheirospermum japonicum]
MASSSSEEENAVAPDLELVEELKKLVVEYGSELLKSFGSTDELLKKLDDFDHVLSVTIQDLKVQFEEAIKPSKDALIAKEYIRHAEMDVRVSVVSCISEIIRILAPDDPYEDDQMREFFQAAVNAFESLSCMSGRAYTKAVSILRTISYSQSCVLMLDIRMHDLIHQMFRTFFNVIRASHSDAIFSDMENIMTLIIREDVDCDESAVELAKILLSKLKKESQNVSPVAFRLAENTFKKCSDKLKEYLPEAVRCLGLPVEDYADVVVSLLRDPTPSEDMDSEYVVDDTSCHGEASLSIDSGSSSLAEGNETVETEKTEIFDTNENFHENQQTTSQSCDEPDNLGSPEQQQEMLSENVPIRGKRSRKQNSLIKLEEGYDPLWLLGSCAAMTNSSGNKKRKRSGHPQKDIMEENHRGKNIVSEDLEGDIIAKNHLENRQESSDRKGKGKMVISEDETEDDCETLASESKSVSSKGEALSGELSNPLYESKSTPSKQEASEERDAGNCLRGELVGRRVKVWWPLDRMFYEGTITFFDHLNKRHMVTYDDGEIESLDLVEECWLFIDENGVGRLFSLESFLSRTKKFSLGSPIAVRLKRQRKRWILFWVEELAVQKWSPSEWSELEPRGSHSKDERFNLVLTAVQVSWGIVTKKENAEVAGWPGFRSDLDY